MTGPRGGPPLMIAADMAYNGLAIPEGGRYLGSRIEGEERVIAWQLPDGSLLEQRMPRQKVRPPEPEGVTVKAEMVPPWPPIRLVKR